MLTARRQTKSNKGKNALTINEGIMAARPERVAISPLGVTCKGGLGKNFTLRAYSPSWNWECGAGEAPIARRPCPQVQPLCCVRFGACTFGIFACPAPATLAGRALFFGTSISLTLTPAIVRSAKEGHNTYDNASSMTIVCTSHYSTDSRNQKTIIDTMERMLVVHT